MSLVATPPSSTQAIKGHLDFVDALRGWAILGVIGCHLHFRIVPNTGPISTFLGEGSRGVQLFFVVSAFTLMRSMHERAAIRPESSAVFLVRRFFRIAPMFYLGIVFYWFWYSGQPRAEAPHGTTIATLVETLLLFHGWRPDTINAAVPGGWSIAVEAMFYLLLPFIFRYILSLPRALAFFAVGWLIDRFFSSVTVMAWMFPDWATPEHYYVFNIFRFCWLPPQLPVFACGILLYFFLDGRSARNSAALVASAFLGGLILSLSYTRLIPQHIVIGLGYLLLGWGLAHRPITLLVNPILCFIGRVSFSVYVLHFAVLEVVCPWLGLGSMSEVPRLSSFSQAPWSVARSSELVQITMVFGMVLLVVLPLSALTYRYVELPGQSLGRKVIRSFFSRPASPS